MPRLLLLLSIFTLIVLAVRGVLLHLAGAAGARQRQRPRVEPAAADQAQDGGFMHRVLMDAYGVEREAWALQRVQRVERRLQRGRRLADRRRVEILWIAECNAFTAPGPWVYVSRRLLERCPDDDTLAMIVAHELAHHDLGHLASPLGANWLWLIQRLATSPEQEAEADAHGFNLCLAAGYDPERCLHAFDLLEAHALDQGDRAGVYGPEREIAAALDGQPEWRVTLERWLHTRRRGYAPVRERKAALWDAYQAALSRLQTG
jgi:predicted Zn-dependent protease